MIAMSISKRLLYAFEEAQGSAAHCRHHFQETSELWALPAHAVARELSLWVYLVSMCRFCKFPCPSASLRDVLIS